MQINDRNRKKFLFILFQGLRIQSSCLLWAFRWLGFTITAVFHAKEAYNLSFGDHSK